MPRAVGWLQRLTAHGGFAAVVERLRNHATIREKLFIIINKQINNN
jgi:hypothetical protein